MPALCNLLVLLFAAEAAAQLTTTTTQPSSKWVVSTLVPAINNLIQTWPRSDLQDSPESRSPLPLNGGFLRLAFHDCAGAGGCDGCLGLSLPENAGLADPVAALDTLYNDKVLKTKAIMSRADLWALAGVVVTGNRMKIGAPTGWTLPTLLDPRNFKFGRIDCSTSPLSGTDKSSNFPSAFFNTMATVQYFTARFGYNAQQTVAIMGAHHIGRMHQRNSGFKGAWVPNEVMDGQFYRSLIDPSVNWKQEVINCSIPPHTHKVSYSGITPSAARGANCSACDESYMLDADVSIYKDFGKAEFNGAVACGFSNCPLAKATSQFVVQYATDGNRFKQDFAQVFNQMLSVCKRQSTGSPIWCSFATLSGLKTALETADGDAGASSSDTDAASGDHPELYALFSILVVLPLAAAYGFYRRHKHTTLVETTFSAAQCTPMGDCSQQFGTPAAGLGIEVDDDVLPPTAAQTPGLSEHGL